MPSSTRTSGFFPRATAAPVQVASSCELHTLLREFHHHPWTEAISRVADVAGDFKLSQCGFEDIERIVRQQLAIRFTRWQGVIKSRLGLVRFRARGVIEIQG